MRFTRTLALFFIFGVTANVAAACDTLAVKDGYSLVYCGPGSWEVHGQGQVYDLSLVGSLSANGRNAYTGEFNTQQKMMITFSSNENGGDWRIRRVVTAEQFDQF